MTFKAPFWIFAFIISSSLFATEYKADSGAVKSYLSQNAYYHLANTVTDESVQNELINIITALNKKEFQLLVSPNESQFIAKNIINEACGCDAIVVNLSSFNEDLLSNIVFEYNNLKVRKELESLSSEFIESLDLNNSSFLKTAIYFYLELKPQIKFHKSLRAGLPNSEISASSNDEIAERITNKLSIENDVYFNDKLIQALKLKTQSSDLKNYLLELSKNKTLLNEFNKLNQKTEEAPAVEVSQSKALIIFSSDEMPDMKN